MSDYYGTQDQERLDSEPEDTIINLMDDLTYDDLSNFNFPIKVYGFEPQKPFKNIERYASNILENILEDLDENYADPDNYETKPTPSMKKAALDFVGILSEEYQVFACELTGEIFEYSKEDVIKILGIKDN